MTRITKRCLTPGKSIFQRCRKQLGRESGNASLELALALSMFGAPLMLGTSEAAFMIYDSIEVSNAAHAGAMYGMISSTLASDTSGIQRAAQGEAADFGNNLTVTPTVYYACSNAVTGTQYSTESAASAVCPGNNPSNHYLEFVQVASSISVTSPVQMPGLPKTWTLNGSSTMEVQE
jgi:Flp pilus assembly protein TadG